MVCPIRHNAAWRQGYFIVCLFTFVYTAPTEAPSRSHGVDAHSTQWLEAAGEIKLTVSPRVASRSPFNPQTFHVRVQIPYDKGNRLWSYSASCGNKVVSSEHDITGTFPVLAEWDEGMVVEDDCYFQACVFRIEGKKVQPHCDIENVTTPGDPF